VWCEFVVDMFICIYSTPIFNVFTMEYFMKQNSYNIMLSIWEKQRNGDRLFDAEIKWKKKYNKSREESRSEVDGVKVTRYKPAWVASKVM
jgi:hypothetical protein